MSTPPTSTPTSSAPGPARVRRRWPGWPLAALAVLVAAVVQALLALVSPMPGWSPGFVALVLVSFTVAVAAL